MTEQNNGAAAIASADQVRATDRELDAALDALAGSIDPARLTEFEPKPEGEEDPAGALDLLEDDDVSALTNNRRYGEEPFTAFLDRYAADAGARSACLYQGQAHSIARTCRGGGRSGDSM